MDNIFHIVDRYSHKAPVDIQAIIRDAGIAYYEEARPETISGLIERHGDGYRIVVNSSHPRTRKRFTAAHELGHYVYHRDIIGDGIYDNAAYRSSIVGLHGNPKITQAHETQANRFAAVVLMPSSLMEALMQQHSWEMPRDVAQLARGLDVSEKALRIRLRLDEIPF